MLKRCLVVGPAVWVLLFGLWVGPKYDRFVLPAFDGHAYDSMTEAPRIFTLPPWGYRILEPWIVSLIPASSSAVAFFWLNVLLLSGAIFVVGWWLRRLGFSSAAAALASFLFAISPPFRVVMNYQILVDPLALLLMVAIFCELVDPDVVVLAALFALSALTKETGLLALVLVPLALIPREGWVRGALNSAVVAAPALALALLLRLTWGHAVLPPDAFSFFDVTIGRVLQSGGALAVSAMLSGLMIPAVIGAFREKSWALAIQAGLMWSFTFGLIVSNPYHYSVSDLPRLSLFAWPALLPLALRGVGFVRAEPPVRVVLSHRRPTYAAIAALIVCLALVAATDPYERAPFPITPEPIAMTGRIRESVKTARLLEDGGLFSFDTRSGRFATPPKERFNLTEGRRQRWFLYRGFGADAAFAPGTPEFHSQAELLLPVFTPRPGRMTLEIDGPKGAEVVVLISGHPVGSVSTQAGPSVLEIPRRALIRGDNLVRLQGPSDVSLRLLRWEVVLPVTAPR
ncbi:MAG: hypothetical protein ABI672_03985 [Vicinamibacteria bacterium]